ncbi:hypothetical protein BT69DRAFT_1332013 [Atractiella rhizophila]|nr:hypothetical protein BT69DRAFT_1332013 [Atractiella rhizophila]
MNWGEGQWLGSCSKSYSRKEFVERHRRLQHLDERPFECTQCQSAAFSRSDLLKRHLKTCPGKATLNPDGSVKVRKKRRIAKDAPRGNQDSSESPTQREGENTVGGTSCNSGLPQVLSPTAADFYASLDFLIPNSFDSTSLLTSTNVPSTSNLSTASSETLEPGGVFASDLIDKLLNPSGDPALAQFDVAPEDSPETASSDQHLNVRDWNPSGPLRFQPEDFTPDLLNLSSTGLYLSRDDPDEDKEKQAAEKYMNALAAFTPSTARAKTLAAWEQWVSGQVEEEQQQQEEQAADSPSRMKEPCMMPDSAYVGIDSNVTSKYYIPPEKASLSFWLCFLTYVMPTAYAFHQWSIPALPVLSQYAKLAVTAFLPAIPVAHGASLRMAEMDTHLAYAIAVAGALLAATPEGSLFGDQMLTEKRIYMVRDFSAPGTSFAVKFASLQALLVYQLVGFGHREAHHRSMGHTFHGSAVMMMRQLGLIAMVKKQENEFLPPLYTFANTDLERRWKNWIDVETWRRAAFLVWLSDLECALRFEQAPLLPLAELSLTLPAHDDLWNAVCPTAWAAGGPTYKHPPTFPEALQLLLSDSFPSDINTSPLFPMGSFSFMLISRTLGYMMRSIEDSIQIGGPSRWYDLVKFVEVGGTYQETLKTVQRAFVRLEKFRSSSNSTRVSELSEEWIQNIAA